MKYVAERKIEVERLTEDISSQLATKKELIRAAWRGNPNVQEWQKEMAQLQFRLATEPEEAMRLLCAGIEEATGSKEILQRSTDATNQNLKAEEWARFVLHGLHRSA